MNFNSEFQRRRVINDAIKKKSLFNEYVYRYKELFAMNLREMKSEIKIIAKKFILELFPGTYANIDMVTDSVMSASNSHWVEATDKAVLRVYDEVSRVCVVKGVHSHESIAAAVVHEPFSANMDTQTHILYKWICLCDVCLSTGFCGHSFFAEHNNDSMHSPHTPIPDATHSRSLSSIDALHRSTSRRGRPRNYTMSAVLNNSVNL